MTEENPEFKKFVNLDAVPIKIEDKILAKLRKKGIKETEKKVKPKPVPQVVGEPLAQECPRCKGKVLASTGKTVNGDLVYKCLRCLAYLATPTSYARCSIYKVIYANIFENSCLICPWAKANNIDVHKQVCPNFQGELNKGDTKQTINKLQKIRVFFHEISFL